MCFGFDLNGSLDAIAVHLISKAAIEAVEEIAQYDFDLRAKLNRCSLEKIVRVHSLVEGVNNYFIIVLSDNNGFEIAILMSPDGSLMEFSLANGANYCEYLGDAKFRVYSGNSKYYPD